MTESSVVLHDHGSRVEAERLAEERILEQLAAIGRRVFVLTTPTHPRVRDLATGDTDNVIRKALLEGFRLESITAIEGGALMVYKKESA